MTVYIVANPFSFVTVYLKETAFDIATNQKTERAAEFDPSMIWARPRRWEVGIPKYPPYS